jgi:hypothetical protein
LKWPQLLGLGTLEVVYLVLLDCNWFVIVDGNGTPFEFL